MSNTGQIGKAHGNATVQPFILCKNNYETLSPFQCMFIILWCTSVEHDSVSDLAQSVRVP